MSRKSCCEGCGRDTSSRTGICRKCRIDEKKPEPMSTWDPLADQDYSCDENNGGPTTSDERSGTVRKFDDEGYYYEHED